jgi:hypothetical protein
MKNSIRIFLLFITSILSFAIIIYLMSDPNVATFKKISNYYPIGKLSLTFTILSSIFPYAIKGANNCEKMEYPGLIIFFTTSLIILPVGLAFHPGDLLYYNLFIDKSISLYPYYLVWFFHGAINAFYIRKKII